MNNQLFNLLRPPVGFVVEGHGEHASYPSLVSRIVNTSGFQIPVVNAGGCGGVIRNLHHHLSHLAITFHPFEILITLDLKDIIDQGLFDECEELLISLEESSSNWLESASFDERVHPLPDRIAVVIQVQQFESWIIADIESLVDSGIIYPIEEIPTNVDSDIRNPLRWLNQRRIQKYSLKNPRFIRSIISGLNIDRMQTNSRSFAKFHKEVLACYTRWLAATNSLEV